MLDEECVKLNQHGETSVEFDFFYLPIDFNTDGNYGYALVNFTSSSAVRKIYNAFQGHRWDYLGSDKIVKVNYAHVQGLGMLVSRAKGLKLRRRTQIPDSYLPSLFVPPRNGLRKSVEHLLGNRILI
ncbi:hypothetical protein LUZ60_011854 [Juncus effusus]|nr:hypothetical protein LUZ60_011854 [Juncus effusus]